MSEEAHAHPNYVKVWAILVLLLCISVVGPMLGHPAVTLVTAFGIACVKAYMVAKNFMHVNLEPRFVPYLVLTAVVFMFLFYSGTAPDVMKYEGTHWEKPAWIEANAAFEAGNFHEEAAHH